ncbi:unnamed protein product, partial [marine sediment metagenome]
KKKITSAKLYMKKAGAPSGTGYAKLYAHTGTYGSNGKPTGDPLATSEGFDVSDLTAEYQLITFNFTGEEQYEMQTDTYYCIVFETPASGSIDDDNHPIVGYDSSSPTHDGNYCAYSFNQWGYSSTNDCIFYVYADVVAPPAGGMGAKPPIMELLLAGVLD